MLKYKWWAALFTGNTIGVGDNPVPLREYERLGARQLSIKCCGKVYQVEQLQRGGGYSQWRRINTFICTRCCTRAYIDW